MTHLHTESIYRVFEMMNPGKPGESVNELWGGSDGIRLVLLYHPITLSLSP